MGFYVEINLHNKWLLTCSYNPQKGNVKNQLQAICTSLEIYSSQFDHFTILGDFNVEMKNSEMKEFYKNYNLKSLIRVPACFKNPETSSCTDLILANFPRSFQSCFVVETGLSDFNKMAVAVTKSPLQKLKPRVLLCRNYNFFITKIIETP